tara:strand:+ start:4246 stop:5766 length:1521 start_codon:yes stop_codon:yes gene_type:complete
MLRILFFISIFLFGVTRAQATCATGSVLAPEITSISVDTNGDVVICWDPVLDADLIQYNIYTIDGTGANLQIGTVPLGTNCFTYPGASNSSGTQSLQIFVEAVIDCPPTTISSPGLGTGIGWFSTMYLTGALEPCTASIDMDWNVNDFFNTPRYEVFMITNGGPAVTQGTTFSTSFSYLGVTPGDSINFYIVAVDNGGLGPATSTTNLITPDVRGVLIMPAFNYLNTATVIDSQQIDIQFTIDTIADMTAYKIQRSTSETGPFVTIATVDKVQNMDTIVNYSDTVVDTDGTSYFYQIEIVNDICGFDSNYSNLASTILVSATSSPLEAFNSVTITEYKDWGLGVLRYDLYRAVGGVWELTPVRSFPAFSDTMTFVDDISEVFDGNGEFCYKVVAIEKGTFMESSSNDACALHEPLLYVPNSFLPGGLYNPEFKPVLTFANPNTYSFRVFSRWGVVVFETGDVSSAWNGRFNNSGDLSPTGVYFYVVEFNSAQGDFFIKKGTVTIVH